MTPAPALAPDIYGSAAPELESIRIGLVRLCSIALVAATEAAGVLHRQGFCFDFLEGILKFLDPETARCALEAIDRQG